MNPVWADVVKIVLGGCVGALLSFIIMLVRERNNFATKVMDLFLEDKKNWVDERKQLEGRIDYLTAELDKVKQELYTRGTPE